MRSIRRTITVITLACAALASHAAIAAPIKNVVLVHGFFADGSGWKGVADILARDGYKVAVVQEPETSLADDVHATNRALDAMGGPSILVGHSYGGIVITEAGNHANVAGLVYVAAYQPEVGETLADLAGKIPSGSKAIKPTPDGFLYIEPALFHADFAADLPAPLARFMALSQVMPAVQITKTATTQAAWKTKPSWAIVSKSDMTINPELERFMSKRAGSKTTEIEGSHVAFIARPADVAKVIEEAAKSAGK